MNHLARRLAAGLLATASWGLAAAQSTTPSAPSSLEDGRTWASLGASTQGVLAPLSNQWPALSASTKEKWIGVAKRMHKMAPAERERVQARMASWASLTPIERGQTRLLFQEALRVAPETRAEQWKRYNELSEDEKRQLAARAVPPTVARQVSSSTGRGALFSVTEPSRPSGKVNTTPLLSPLPQGIAPSVIQAQPGASTTLISSKPIPPAHQPAGSPKIAATPKADVRTPEADNKPQ